VQRDQRLGRLVEVEPDALAAPGAEVAQQRGEPAGALVELPVADDALPVDDRRMVRARVRGRRDEVVQGLAHSRRWPAITLRWRSEVPE
jgi:hypothetical protein